MQVMSATAEETPMNHESVHPVPSPGGTAGPLRAIRSQRGIALVFVLFALSVFSLLALTYLIDTRIEAQIVATSRDFHLAQYAAEAGVQEVLIRVNAPLRKKTRTVNGGDVREWMPYDTRNPAVGDDANEDTWKFVHDDRLDDWAVNGTAWKGADTAKMDDWAEYDPQWRANIWYATPQVVEAQFPWSAGTPWVNHYATLVDITTPRPDGLVRTLLEYSIAPDDTNLDRGLRVQWKVANRKKPDGTAVPPEDWKMVFTDGYQQFTMEEGLVLPNFTEAWPVMEIHSVGKYGRAHRRFVAEIANFPIRIPRTAVYACKDPGPSFLGNGNMEIIGYDYPILMPNGQPTSAGGSHVYWPPLNPADYPPVPAVTVCCPKTNPANSSEAWGPGACDVAGREEAATEYQIEINENNNEFYGSNTGDGDSIQVAELDVQALYDAYSSYITPGHEIPADNPADWGSPAGNFYVSRITHPNNGGTMTVHETIGGVLLIDTGSNPGNVVRFNGTTKMYGLVIVVGQGRMDWQGGAEAYGSLLVGTRVRVTGAATVYYSSQALDRIQRLQVHRIIRMSETAL
jgi:hypothetical protein